MNYQLTASESSPKKNWNRPDSRKWHFKFPARKSHWNGAYTNFWKIQERVPIGISRSRCAKWTKTCAGCQQIFVVGSLDFISSMCFSLHASMIYVFPPWRYCDTYGLHFPPSSVSTGVCWAFAVAGRSDLISVFCFSFRKHDIFSLCRGMLR